MQFSASWRPWRAAAWSVALLGCDHGAAVHSPFLDPRYFAALARAGGRWGWGDRTATMRALFADVLPETRDLAPQQGRVQRGDVQQPHAPLRAGLGRAPRNRLDAGGWRGTQADLDRRPDSLGLRHGASGGVVGQSAGRARGAGQPVHRRCGVGTLAGRMSSGNSRPPLSAIREGSAGDGDHVHLRARSGGCCGALRCRRRSRGCVCAVRRAGSTAARSMCQAMAGAWPARLCGHSRRCRTASGCLTRSLVLLALLARRGVPVDLVIAVQPGMEPSSRRARLGRTGRGAAAGGRSSLRPARDALTSKLQFVAGHAEQS